MKAEMDRKEFSELLSKYTKIGKTKILEFLETGTVNDIFQNPKIITDDQSKIKRIEELRLLRNTYDNLKKYDRKYTITSPKTAADFFINSNMDIQDKEYFSIAYLNTKNEIIEVKTTSGTIDHVMLYKREIIKDAFKYNATSIIVSHNHPSGIADPSNDDLNLTGELYKACKTVDINFLDHIITANMNHYSINENHSMNSLGSSHTVFEDKEMYTSKKISIKDKLKAAKEKTEQQEPKNETIKEKSIER